MKLRFALMRGKINLFGLNALAILKLLLPRLRVCRRGPVILNLGVFIPLCPFGPWCLER
jgi:hypothetical protein